MNKTIKIISYKHDGSLHRVWEYVSVLYENDDVLVLMNNMGGVIDGDGKKWKTKEPALCYFYKHQWYNIISIIRNNSIYYYCNLSSPYIIDEEGLKYIDYDLDVKVYPSGEIVVLDRDEFEFNTFEYHYDQEIIDIVENELKKLLQKIKNEEDPFNLETIFNDYKLYMTSLKTR